VRETGERIVKTDYKLEKTELDVLTIATVMSDPMRQAFLTDYLQNRGIKECIRLFSQFIGMANSLEANTRSFIEEYLIVECRHAPQVAARINLPSILGALSGARMAIDPDPKMCHGCAFRHGTPANQSVSTTGQAVECVEGDDLFMCHFNLESGSDPKKQCVGYIRTLQKGGVK
jgi:hypothetical protein